MTDPLHLLDVIAAFVKADALYATYANEDAADAAIDPFLEAAMGAVADALRSLVICVQVDMLPPPSEGDLQEYLVTTTVGGHSVSIEGWYEPEKDRRYEAVPKCSGDGDVLVWSNPNGFQDVTLDGAILLGLAPKALDCPSYTFEEAIDEIAERIQQAIDIALRTKGLL